MQTVIVLALIFAAAVILIVRLIKTFRSPGSSCGSCKGCRPDCNGR